MKDHAAKPDVRKWLLSLVSDPLARTLARSSHLTTAQLETFLIDALAEKISGKAMVYEKKAKLRLIGPGVSRGAFNRTLAQARKNIIKSINTLILLGYLGVFDTPCLEPYVEMANKIRNYTEAYRETWKSGATSAEHLRIIGMLQKQIERELQELSGPKVMSQRS